ncbi:LysR family transcriptional regulator [Streptomyces gossypii]|nr:LysR family transcriptional regulator [Streptomyces gossypii]
MEYLVAVHAAASFTRAAEELNVTQSALSHQIKALEREVGGALLERLPRGVQLTAMGRAFLPDAELAVRSARQARRAARAAAGATGGELQVATLHGLAVGTLPGVVARMREGHPGVRVVLHEYVAQEELLERMERGIADVAFTYEPPPGWSGVAQPVGREELLLVVPGDDPLCGRESVRLEQLADRAWVRCANEPRVEGELFLDWACARLGFLPRTVVVTGHTTTAARMAAAGAGVVPVPSCIAGLVAPPRQLLRMDPPWCRPLSVVSRAQPMGAAAEFVDLLRQAQPGQGL